MSEENKTQAEVEMEMISRVLEEVKSKSGYGYVRIRVYAGAVAEVEEIHSLRIPKRAEKPVSMTSKVQ
jgi:hypothetical protein